MIEQSTNSGHPAKADGPSPSVEPQSVSPVPASVPDASQWRAMDSVPKSGEIVVVCFYPWRVKSNGLRIQLAQWIDVYGNGGRLCVPFVYDSEPYADGWLSLTDFAKAMETRQGQDATHDSAGRQALPETTPKDTLHDTP